MGKKIPLRIGRKSKRELNPVEQLRRKEREKKNLKQFLTKLNKKANGEFQTKVKTRRSPSPESNDPMVGELISSFSLRHPVDQDHDYSVINEENEKNDSELESQHSELETQHSRLQELESSAKAINPHSLAPISTISKRQVIIKKPEKYISDDDSSSSEEEYISKTIKMKPLQSTISQDQSIYKTLLGGDPSLTDFFMSIKDLM